jgi:RNA polymerase sigma factor (sigma-70 family)
MLLKKIICIYFFCCITYVNSIVFIQKFLSNYQLSIIDKILLNPNTDLIMKKKIHNILYIFYDQYAFTKAYKFKQFHKYKCNHISTTELYTYASIGLYKSIQNYNPKYKYSFINYANYFIQGELLKGLTELHPISSISKSNRKKGCSSVKKMNSRVQLVGENNWIWDKMNKDKKEENQPYEYISKMDYYNNIWQKINTLSPFQKRIIYYKYNFFFEKIRSNKEISNLMSCSEEWVRLNIKNAFINIDIDI